jgi:hypothetical protein
MPSKGVIGDFIGHTSQTASDWQSQQVLGSRLAYIEVFVLLQPIRFSALLFSHHFHTVNM